MDLLAVRCPMSSSPRCPGCGLINPNTLLACRRCGRPLLAAEDAPDLPAPDAAQDEAPPDRAVSWTKATLRGAKTSAIVLLSLFAIDLLFRLATRQGASVSPLAARVALQVALVGGVAAFGASCLDQKGWGALGWAAGAAAVAASLAVGVPLARSWSEGFTAARQKSQECDRVTDVLSDVRRKVDRARWDPTHGEQNWLSLLEEIAGQLEAVQPRDPKLSAHLAEYSALAREVAQNLRVAIRTSHSEAIRRAPDQNAREAIRRRIEEDVATEEALWKDLRSYCSLF